MSASSASSLDRPPRPQSHPDHGLHAVSVSTVAELTSIYRDRVNLVVLGRQLSAAAQSFVADLGSEPDFTCSLQVCAEDPQLGDLPFAQHRDADALLTDIQLWVQVFGALFDADQIGLRIAQSHRAMCPRFHVDRVAVRLVCAYAGAGMQWLVDADVDRRRLGHLAGGLSDEESGLIAAGATIQQVPAHAVALCKGDSWPGMAGRGIVHRSPPARAAAGARLVMTLDLL